MDIVRYGFCGSTALYSADISLTMFFFFKFLLIPEIAIICNQILA